ncbi:MAG: NIF family HAD-type phosphatase [Paracoccaceae bacterium]
MKKLLVLDLDETLIHSSELLLHQDPDFTGFDYFVYRRPYLTQFLHFCDNHFSVAVWSSASDDYVLAITQKIFPDPGKLFVVWGVSKTTIRRRHPEEYDLSGQPLTEFHSILGMTRC